MAEPRKLSNWLAAAKALPTNLPADPSSPGQLSRLVALCKSSKGKTSGDWDSFVTILRPSQRGKSKSPTKEGRGAAQAEVLPVKEDFPALASPPKSGGQVKKGVRDTGGKEREALDKVSGKQLGKGQTAVASCPEMKEEKKALLLPEVTAEFDGLMSELLTGLRLQGPELHLADSPQTRGLADGEGAPGRATPVQVQTLSDSRASATPRVLFPEDASKQTSDLASGSKASATAEKEKVEAKTQTALSPPNPLSHELSFFAVPPKTPKVGAPKTPNPYSPKSVLDLSSPIGFPAANQIPPAGITRSPYRPAMTPDPKKVIGRKAESQSSPANVVTSSPFSYSLWGPAGPLLMSPPLQAEAHILKESPSNLVKGSRLATWLGKEKASSLDTEGLQRTGAFVRPTPFAQRLQANSTDEDEGLCKICFEKESNSAYLCGHVLCGDCAEFIHVNRKICPFCAKPIESVVRMFV